MPSIEENGENGIGPLELWLILVVAGVVPIGIGFVIDIIFYDAAWFGLG